VLSTYSAEQLVVLDESSKDGRTLIRKYGRALSGDDAVLNVSLDRGIRYSILPALTLGGYIAIRAVEGSIDAGEFFDFVVDDVVSLYCLGTCYEANQLEAPLHECIPRSSKCYTP